MGPSSEVSEIKNNFDISTVCKRCRADDHLSSECQRERIFFCWFCGRRDTKTTLCCSDEKDTDSSSSSNRVSYPKNPFYYDKENGLCVIVGMGYELVHAKIDTSSFRSFIGELYANELGTQNNIIYNQIRVPSSNGTVKIFKEELRTRVKLGSWQGLVSFVVNPNITSHIVLGLDFLMLTNTKLTTCGVDIILKSPTPAPVSEISTPKSDLKTQYDNQTATANAFELQQTEEENKTINFKISSLTSIANLPPECTQSSVQIPLSGETSSSGHLTRHNCELSASNTPDPTNSIYHSKNDVDTTIAGTSTEKFLSTANDKEVTSTAKDKNGSTVKDKPELKEQNSADSSCESGPKELAENYKEREGKANDKEALTNRRITKGLSLKESCSSEPSSSKTCFNASEGKSSSTSVTKGKRADKSSSSSNKELAIETKPEEEEPQSKNVAPLGRLINKYCWPAELRDFIERNRLKDCGQNPLIKTVAGINYSITFKGYEVTVRTASPVQNLTAEPPKKSINPTLLGKRKPRNNEDACRSKVIRTIEASKVIRTIEASKADSQCVEKSKTATAANIEINSKEKCDQDISAQNSDSNKTSTSKAQQSESRKRRLSFGAEDSTAAVCKLMRSNESKDISSSESTIPRRWHLLSMQKWPLELKTEIEDLKLIWHQLEKDVNDKGVTLKIAADTYKVKLNAAATIEWIKVYEPTTVEKENQSSKSTNIIEFKENQNTTKAIEINSIFINDSDGKATPTSKETQHSVTKTSTLASAKVSQFNDNQLISDTSDNVNIKTQHENESTFAQSVISDSTMIRLHESSVAIGQNIENDNEKSSVNNLSNISNTGENEDYAVPSTSQYTTTYFISPGEQPKKLRKKINQYLAIKNRQQPINFQKIVRGREYIVSIDTADKVQVQRVVRAEKELNLLKRFYSNETDTMDDDVANEVEFVETEKSIQEETTKTKGIKQISPPWPFPKTWKFMTPVRADEIPPELCESIITNLRRNIRTRCREEINGIAYSFDINYRRYTVCVHRHTQHYANSQQSKIVLSLHMPIFKELLRQIIRQDFIPLREQPKKLLELIEIYKIHFDASSPSRPLREVINGIEYVATILPNSQVRVDCIKYVEAVVRLPKHYQHETLPPNRKTNRIACITSEEPNSSNKIKDTKLPSSNSKQALEVSPLTNDLVSSSNNSLENSSLEMMSDNRHSIAEKQQSINKELREELQNLCQNFEKHFEKSLIKELNDFFSSPTTEQDLLDTQNENSIELNPTEASDNKPVTTDLGNEIIEHRNFRGNAPEDSNKLYKDANETSFSEQTPNKESNASNSTVKSPSSELPSASQLAVHQKRTLLKIRTPQDISKLAKISFVESLSDEKQ